tara:strand:+ start:1959 stop:2138 length:180 start_codon:yes stop_codon:yes gene_type:complete
MEYDITIRLKVDPNSSYFGVDQTLFNQGSKSNTIVEIVSDALYELDDTKIMHIEAEEIQ